MPALTPEQIEALRGLQESGIITAEEFARRAGAANTQAAPAGDGSTREIAFQTATFGRQLRGATLRIPVDWRAEARTIPMQTAPGKAAACQPGLCWFLADAIAPDGLTALHMLPGDAWVWSDQPQVAQILQFAVHAPGTLSACEVRPIPDAANWLKTAVLHRLPQAWGQELRLVAEEKAPEILNRAHRLIEAARARGQQIPPETQMRFSAARLRFTGRQGSQPIAMTVEAGLLMTWQTAPGLPGVAMMAVVPEVSCRTAPAGGMQAAHQVFEDIADSLKIEDAFTQAQMQFQQQFHQRQEMLNQQANQQAMANSQTQQQVLMMQHQTNMDNIRAAGERARISHNAQQQRFDRQNASWARNQARVHGAAQQFAYSLNDQQQVYNPMMGGTMLVSNQFNHAYGDQWGNIVYTDSPGFDPNASLSGNWDELRPVRY